jgi:hypothetical protein
MTADARGRLKSRPPWLTGQNFDDPKAQGDFRNLAQRLFRGVIHRSIPPRLTPASHGYGGQRICSAKPVVLYETNKQAKHSSQLFGQPP